MKRTSIAGKGADIFFPSIINSSRTKSGFTVEQNKLPSVDKKSANSRTVPKITVEQYQKNRVAKYRRAWKKEGLVQVSFWLSKQVVNKLKSCALKEGKKYSALADEILRRHLR